MRSPARDAKSIGRANLRGPIGARWLNAQLKDLRDIRQGDRNPLKNALAFFGDSAPHCL
jgi:hypothetical protein